MTRLSVLLIGDGLYSMNPKRIDFILQYRETKNRDDYIN